MLLKPFRVFCLPPLCTAVGHETQAVDVSFGKSNGMESGLRCGAAKAFADGCGV